MLIVFWLGIVPMIGLIIFVAVTGKLTRPDLPLESLPAWRRELRLFLFPKIDATSEEIARMERDKAARAEEVRHEALVRAVYNAAATGRAP